MAYSLYLKFNVLPKTMNQLLGGGRWANKKESDFWKDLVFHATLGKKPPEPLKTAKLVLVRASSKEPDYDNLCSGFKKITDALTKFGIIIDDRMSVIGIPEFKWVKTPPKKGYVEIYVSG